MTAFYDEQMAETVKSAMAYLATERGQRAINRIAQKDGELNHAIGVVALHKIPWGNLTQPGWAQERERDMPLRSDAPQSDGGSEHG